MKRLHVKDIIIGKTYYKLCVGNIEPITINKISAKICFFMDNKDNYENDLTFGDMGFAGANYENNLNFVFETLAEAEEMKNSKQYNEELTQHKEECDSWDDFVVWQRGDYYGY